MLRDPYYVGRVVYQGEEYSGRHEPLVSDELFARVQATITANKQTGTRQRRHNHYLRGTLWCARCQEHGRQSRMIVQRTVNRHGETYYYYFCRARQEGLCRAPYVPVDQLEERILAYYASLQVTPEFRAKVSELVDAALDDSGRSQALLHEQLTKRLVSLESREENLLDLAADATIPKERLRQRLAAIAVEREQITKDLGNTNGDLAAGAQVIRQVLELLRDPQELYRRGDDRVRSLLNQAIFERIYIEGDEVGEEEMTEPFEALVSYERARPAQRWRANKNKRCTRRGTALACTTSAGLLATWT